MSYSTFLERMEQTGRRKIRQPPVKQVKIVTRITSDCIPGNGTKREANKYTGDELMGIATMHKSNAVPVRKDNKQHATEISGMRR